MQAATDALAQGLAGNDVLIVAFNAVGHDAHGFVGDAGAHAVFLGHHIEDFHSGIDSGTVLIEQVINNLVADSHFDVELAMDAVGHTV